MVRIGILLFIATCCRIIAADDQLPPADQAALDRATQGHLSQATKAYDAYRAALNDAGAKTIKDLDKLKVKAMHDGNLPLANAVDAEEKKIKDGAMNDNIVTGWANQNSTDMLGVPNLLSTMQGDHATDGDLFVINERQRLITKDTFPVPSDIHVVVMTNKDEIRLAYGCDEMIFGWSDDHYQFRVGGGPASGQHKPNAGTVSPNKWYDIELKTTNKDMTIFVEGKQWQHLVGDFSGINDPVTIFTHGDAILKIKSVTVTKLDSP